MTIVFLLSDHNYHHVFIPLPSESVLNVYDEVHLDVALPRSQLEIENSATSTAEALTSLHLALEMKLIY